MYWDPSDGIEDPEEMKNSSFKTLIMNELSNKMYGEEICKILVDVEKLLWLRNGEQLDMPKEGFRASIQIFMTALMDKMWNLQESENLASEDRLKMAIKAGDDLHRLVKTYTDIDTKKMYEDASHLEF